MSSRSGQIFRWLLATCITLLFSLNAHAISLDQALQVVKGSNKQRIEAIKSVATSGEPGVKELLSALSKRRVWYTDEQVVYKQGSQVIDAVTTEPVAMPEDAKRAKANNRIRRTIRDVVAALDLFDEDRDRRLAAVNRMTGRGGRGSAEIFERALAAEEDPQIKKILEIAVAQSRITDDDPAVRLQAARSLRSGDSRKISQLLRSRLAKGDDDEYIESNAAVRDALNSSFREVEHRIFMSEAGSTLFAGISLGSVLLLAALGLAITYGLMGVINLAHGELMMIGAYATYMAQEIFRAYLPASSFNQYLLLAIPMSFLTAALVGALLERFVIRYLYGRPLETLLATWGISLILMQSVRNLFGAQNVTVENPSWMSGGMVITENLVLPYNRLAIIVFAILVMIAVGIVIARTRLGLFVRATTQNRTMARCVGVPTQRTDLLAFALGSGVAGLAGCALSQIGNVGPDLGQSYIVDSFLVVVVGGVGQLAGAIIAGLGLGIFNKILEEMTGAVIAKIVLLVAVIIFIQRRPQGIFALRGRSA